MGVSPWGQTSDTVPGDGTVQAARRRGAPLPERRLVLEAAVLRAHHPPHQLHR